MLGGKVVSAYRRQAVTGRVQISPWPLGMMPQRRKTARSLCEGSDMADAERASTATTGLRRPRGQRAPAQVLSDQPRSAQHGTTNGTTGQPRLVAQRKRGLTKKVAKHLMEHAPERP